VGVDHRGEATGPVRRTEGVVVTVRTWLPTPGSSAGSRSSPPSPRSRWQAAAGTTTTWRPGPEGPVTSLTITSTDLSFDIEAFEVPVGEEVTVTYENEHEGVPHNLHVDTGGPDEPTTEVVDGPVTQELTFTLDEAGEVPYVCDVHPATMRGTITASEPGAAGA
jgi:plastocyanin